MNNTFDIQIAQIRATEKLADANMEVAKAQQLDIETKDRIDISLKRYEEMRDQIKSLEELLEAYKVDNSHMTDLLLHLDIPEKILSKIDPFMVKTKMIDDSFDCIEQGKVKFVISFDINAEDSIND